MYSMWYKYIYNKIKMKNLPILLTFYWLSVQIFTIASLFNGIPSIPSPSHIYNIMEKSDNTKLESQMTSKLETLFLNETKGVRSSSSAHKSSPEKGIRVAAEKPSEKQIEPSSYKGADSDRIVPNRESSNETHPPVEEMEDGQELKDEIIDSVPMEPTPLADSDFVTEDPSQVNPEQEATEGEDVVNDGSETEQKQNATSSEEHPIPVFSEWAKQMEKAEKKQEQDVANASTNKNKTTDKPRVSSTKVRAKNYASPDCGAKIIAANQESDNTGHVLSSSKDEYLISICTSRIWFVVELCEPIQAEKVELANFELFSSSPKEFSVSVSNRYPTRDWSNVGEFLAKDERTIQNFDLDPKLFGKFVRVDIHSHYNTEHFCPVSLFRVQGTSEFEAFETADLKVPLEDYDDDDEAEGNSKKDATKQDNNLFKSASDAVLSIVKKAAQVLTKADDKNADGTEGNTKEGQNGSGGCVTLPYVVACERCQESVASNAADLLTCRNRLLDNLWQWHLVRDLVYQTDICLEITGVNVKRCDDDALSNSRDLRRDFVAKLLSEAQLIAMCNVAGMKERRLPKVNTKAQREEQITEGVVNNLTIDGPGLMEMIPKNVESPFEHLVFDPREVMKEGERKLIVEIEKTPEEGKENVQEERPVEPVNTLDVPPTAAPEPSETDTQLDRPPEPEEIKSTGQQVKEEEVLKEVPPAAIDPWRNPETSLDLNGETGNLVQKVHGESVFLRLSNRIKALERNMSLSSQYLDELSRRYKKQVEELQQSFAKTIVTFEETSKQTVEEKEQLEGENARLKRDIEDVLENFLAWKSILFYLCIFVCIQIVLFVLLLLLYIKNRLRERRREKRREEEDQLRHLELRRISVAADSKGGRRNSTEGISVSSRSTTSLSEGKKRPSEEALQIVGTYSELLLESPKESATVAVTQPGSGNGKKKNKSGRSRKTSLPNQVYQTEKKKNELMHSNSVNGYSSGGHETDASVPVPPTEDPVLLEENDEFYLPGSDLTYVEFVAEGGEEATKSAEQKKNSRRLSSPAFLKTALSRSSRRGGKKKEVLQGAEEDVQSTTSNSSWDWLRRSSSSSQARSEQFVGAANGSAGGGLRLGLANGSASLSSQDSVNPAAAEGEGESSPKKTTKFRKIFKKVF